MALDPGSRRGRRNLARQQNAQQILQASRTVQTIQTYAGPLPQPEDLQRYDEIVPGMAERLLTGFEKQTDHRMALERYVIQADVRRANLGLGAALTFGLAVLAGSVYLIVNGHSDEGTKAIITEFLTYGGAFLYGDIQRRRERNRKASGR